MSVLFSNQGYGEVKRLNDQYIETKFYLLIFPFASYFVFPTPEVGIRKIEIPLNNISLRSFYQSMLMMLGPLALFFGLIFSGAELRWLTNIWEYAPILIALSFSTCGVVFLFTFGKSNPQEKKRRIVLEEVVGINALPEWLSEKTRLEHFKILSAKLPANWKALISQQQFDTKLYYLLFAAICYQKEIEKTEENEQLFLLLDKRINN